MNFDQTGRLPSKFDLELAKLLEGLYDGSIKHEQIVAPHGEDPRTTNFFRLVKKHCPSCPW